MNKKAACKFTGRFRVECAVFVLRLHAWAGGTFGF